MKRSTNGAAIKPPVKYKLATAPLAFICCFLATQPGYTDTSTCMLAKPALTMCSPLLSTVLPGMKPVIMSELWIPIPKWLAGTWHGSSQLVLYSYNYKECRNVIEEPIKIEISRSSTIGVQQDSSGQIWHYTGAPYVQTIRTPNYIEHQQINRLSVLKSMPAAFTVRSESTVTHTDRVNNELLDEFIERTDTTYEPLSEQMLKVTFLVEDFDTQGRPRNVSKSVCIQSRVNAFRPVDQDSRGNLQELFLRFLELNRYFGR